MDKHYCLQQKRGKKPQFGEPQKKKMYPQETQKCHHPQEKKIPQGEGKEKSIK